MATYLHPGVYVEEIPTLPASVAPVSTAIPAFIGYTELATLAGKPTRISSFVEYVELFGDAPLETTISINIDATTLLPVSATIGTPSPFRMYHALQMYFLNGGGPCYILSIGNYSTAGAPQKSDMDALSTNGLPKLAKEDEPTLIVFPDAPGLSDSDKYALYDEALAQCELLKDRFVIMDLNRNSDTLPTANDPHGTFRGAIGPASLKYGATYFPWVQTNLRFNYADLNVTVNAPGTGNLVAPARTSEFLNLAYAAIDKLGVVMAPAAAMAGVYASVDRTRGVWKAPANVGLNAVIKPDKKITDSIQENMNVDVNGGKSINAIRAFTGRGTLVWGARTLAGNDAEWRYIPVRRLFIFVEESIKNATENVVFEPNDANTWVKVKGTIQNFLTTLWRQGALAGAKPEDAFFVKVGLGETMIPQDILEGNMIIEVGMAAVRPAEFIILRFSHKLQES